MTAERVQRELKDRQKLAVRGLRKLFDEIDEQTLRPGEKPLREAAAEQARERLAELDADRLDGTT